MPLDAEQAAEPYCYLTTTGRVTGTPHEIEIWFGHAAERASTIYLLSGGRDASDWVRNLARDPRVTVRIRDHTFAARARVVAASSDEDALARSLLFAKYQAGYANDLTSWRDSALPVAIDLS
jgi:deazaflavin-dependent oxidoreductase (nitroreductase family)